MGSEGKGEDIPEGLSSVEDISYLPLIKHLQSHTLGHADGFIRIQPFKQVFPTYMKTCLYNIRNFHVIENDIWISSFPKSGTTWTQEMVWCICNDTDIDKAKATSLNERVPFFEYTAIAPVLRDVLPNSFEAVDNLPPPRIIKTHLSFEMLPKQIVGRKLIYVARNPRDVCVSFYNHHRILEAYSGTFENFAELFLNDIGCYYTPFIPHVLSYWNQRHSPSILFITYEEMKEDLPSVIRKVARFLGKEISDDDVRNLEDHLSFDNMKENPAVNNQSIIQMVNKRYTEHHGDLQDRSKSEFMRKGEKGNWKEHINGDLLEQFKEWECKGLKNTDLKFIFE